MRVASASADNGFGHVALPRVGQEVVVDFINGDPDHPIVIGSVYNGDKHQPYPLSDDKTRSVWRSHTINGGADDYNEISMEDKTGEEIFNVQAQKDRTTLVKNNDTTTVGNNLSMTVQKGDETREVQQGKRTTTIQQDETLTVKEGNMSTEVSMGNQATAVKMGNVTMNVDMGLVTIEAMQSIELKVGQSSVKLDQMGVTIKGMIIDVEAQVQLSEKGLMTQITSDPPMTQISGGYDDHDLTADSEARWRTGHAVTVRPRRGQVTEPAHGIWLKARHVDASRAGAPPEAYFRRDLRSSARLNDAVFFLGMALPRRETVAWAARSVRDLVEEMDRPRADTEALRAALLWVQDPMNERRRAGFHGREAGQRPTASAERLAAMAVFYVRRLAAPWRTFAIARTGAA